MDYTTEYEDGILPGTRVRRDGSRGVIWTVLGRELLDVEPEPVKDVCDRCEGQGWHDLERGTCEVCHGSGEMTYTPEEWDTAIGDGYVVKMVGDDRHHWADADDLTPVGDDEHVCSCGQDGCGWD